MKSKLLVLGLLAGGSMFAGTRVYAGIGGYAPPPVVAYATPCPGPGYTWTAGFWDYSGPLRFWHAGYWAPPRYRAERFDRGHGRDHDRGRDFRGEGRR